MDVNLFGFLLLLLSSIVLFAHAYDSNVPIVKELWFIDSFASFFYWFIEFESGSMHVLSLFIRITFYLECSKCVILCEIQFVERNSVLRNLNGAIEFSSRGKESPFSAANLNFRYQNFAAKIYCEHNIHQCKVAKIAEPIFVCELLI